MDYILHEIEALSPTSVLDVGCGDGYMINQLCNRAYSGDLRGVDMSARAISFANAFCPRPDTFRAQDIFSLTEKSELVSMIEVIEHIPDDIVIGFIEQAFSLSSKYVLISVPTTALALQKKHYRHYDEMILEQQTRGVQNEFSLIKSVRLYNGRPYLALVKKLLENRFLSLTNSRIIKAIWAYHKKNTYFADSPNGYHLVALYKRK